MGFSGNQLKACRLKDLADRYKQIIRRAGAQETFRAKARLEFEGRMGSKQRWSRSDLGSFPLDIEKSAAINRIRFAGDKAEIS
jgi:hypothetical protein